jgi:hypothetical protein
VPDPVFDQRDRVTDVSQLPAELRGVTDPVKIAQYYQGREARLRTELAAQPVKTETSRVTIEQKTDDKPVVMTQAEAEGARSTLIQTARNTAKLGKKYWDRLSADIEKLMSPMAPEDKVNSDVWSTVYNTLVGMNYEKLTSEDAASAAEATRIASERSTAPASLQEAPPPLPIEVTGKILPGLGISEEQYRKSQEHIAKGVWPLTAENVSGKRVTIGSEK